MEVPETAFEFQPLARSEYTPIWGKNVRFLLFEQFCLFQNGKMPRCSFGTVAWCMANDVWNFRNENFADTRGI